MLQTALPDLGIVEVRELAEESLVEQAKIYLSTSVLIQMHGAALGRTCSCILHDSSHLTHHPV